jgi:hypothetical protein
MSDQFERAAYLWWHKHNLCFNCGGGGIVGPYDDPDPCHVCEGFGHLNGFDLYKEEALAAYREHLSRRAA